MNLPPYFVWHGNTEKIAGFAASRLFPEAGSSRYYDSMGLAMTDVADQKELPEFKKVVHHSVTLGDTNFEIVEKARNQIGGLMVALNADFEYLKYEGPVSLVFEKTVREFVRVLTVYVFVPAEGSE